MGVGGATINTEKLCADFQSALGKTKRGTLKEMKQLASKVLLGIFLAAVDAYYGKCLIAIV